jgi:putative ABC transport system permease protein
MGTALWKDFFREIRKSFGRFISIFTIVFIGVGFFAGVKATAPSMKHSMDLYYDEYNLMDIRVMSTLGLTEEDIQEIQKTDGVHAVQPGYFTDVVSTVDSTEFVFKIHSIPSVSEKEPDKDFINRFKLTEGRYPQKSGECIIEDSIIMDIGLSIGDTLKVSSGKQQAITDGTLAVDEFTVVGKALTPYYLSYEKGASDIGSGKVNTFLMIREEDFTLPVYTEALVTVKNAKQLNSYSKDYQELVSKVVVSLENLGVDRSKIRIEKIKKDAMDELDKAKREFEAQKQLFNEEIKKGEEELNQAQMELVEGETKLETERKNFQTAYEQASKQIAEGEAKLAQAEKDYAKAAAQYRAAMQEYGDDLEKLDKAATQINTQRAKADEQLASLEKRLEDPDLSEEDRQSTVELIGLYEDFLSVTDRGVNAVNSLNNFGQGQVKNAQTQLNNARTELNKQSAQLAKAKAELAQGKKDAEAQFAASEKELSAGWEEYKKGKAEYEKRKAEGEKKLEEGQEKIIRAENEIEKLSNPEWYVLDRNYHYSYVDYGNTADRIDAIAKIFPAFFFLVASLVCLTTMTRMVDEQRGIIGVYKALGYSSSSIAMKFVLYAAVASILGGISGLYLGMRIFPEVIYHAWSMMYTLPPLQMVRQIPLMVISVVIGVLVTTLSALGACYKELKETPALLMRPKAPKMGKTILLERVHFLWKRFSFSQKVTARNLFRYKKRFFMTIIGITGCTALLLAGFGLNDSISQIVNKQYKEIFRYNLDTKFQAIATEEEQKDVMDILQGDQNVASYLTGTEINAKVRSEKEDIAVTLIIPTDAGKLGDYITLMVAISRILSLILILVRLYRTTKASRPAEIMMTMTMLFRILTVSSKVAAAAE